MGPQSKAWLVTPAAGTRAAAATAAAAAGAARNGAPVYRSVNAGKQTAGVNAAAGFAGDRIISFFKRAERIKNRPAIGAFVFV